MSYVVVAEFDAAGGRLDDFLGLLRRHATLSRAEPGCFAFEIALDAELPARVLLYEVYRDEAAYRDHRATEHYARFRVEAPAMLDRSGGDIFRRRSVMRRVT